LIAAPVTACTMRTVSEMMYQKFFTSSKEMPGKILLHAQAKTMQGDWSLLSALNKKFLLTQ